MKELCAKVISFDHVMTPVVKIINSRPQQRTSFTSFLGKIEGFMQSKGKDV